MLAGADHMMKSKTGEQTLSAQKGVHNIAFKRESPKYVIQIIISPIEEKDRVSRKFIMRVNHVWVWDDVFKETVFELKSLRM